jgi:exodeoxyribonuclease-1
MNTYIFYDLETTGLNRAFDQILQFAAIRTDGGLQELERHNLQTKLRPDIVPSPSAMITNRISPKDAAQGMSEYKAVAEIHQILNTPETVSVGYNNLGFDDEFIRFSFYRNLFSPYTHQYSRGCRRMDILPMAVLFFLYKPEILSWPEVDGKAVLQLEAIAKRNDLVSGQSHEAMVDTEATLNLARVFRQESEMWDYICGFFFKQTDLQRQEKLPVVMESEWGPHKKGLMTGAVFGPENGYQIPVLGLGKSIPYNNQTLWLRLDLESICRTEAENIAETTRVIRKRAGEPAFILPPLPRFTGRIAAERMQMAAENVRWLEGHPQGFSEIIRYYKEYEYPIIPDIDADSALYQVGFLNRKDQENIDCFHTEDLPGKIKRIGTFSKAETRALARRLIWRNFKNHRDDQMEEDRRRYFAGLHPENENDAYRDYRGESRRTVRKAFLEIEDIRRRNGIDQQQAKILSELEVYLHALEA